MLNLTLNIGFVPIFSFWALHLSLPAGVLLSEVDGDAPKTDLGESRRTLVVLSGRTAFYLLRLKEEEELRELDLGSVNLEVPSEQKFGK